ncbi:MAG: hypothetical protein D4R67_09465 [Bacteroidetes bacterium]|nr:MAG: hypothetical protein D4R67_09465 [Bacteroidota bacterium]
MKVNIIRIKSLELAREADFWLTLLCETGYLTKEKADAAIKLCDEVIRIVFAILKTSSQTK